MSTCDLHNKAHFHNSMRQKWPDNSIHFINEEINVSFALVLHLQLIEAYSQRSSFRKMKF